MSKSFVQFLATIIENCLGDHHMQPPLVVTVGDKRALVANINERSELVVLTRQR